MKKIGMIFLLVLLLIFPLIGCSSKNLLNKIPDHEFKSFEYHRAGNATSTHIVATNAIRVGNMVEIEKIKISSDYGPFANFLIIIEEYKR